MLTAEEFTVRMDRVGQRVALLAAQPDNAASQAAVELLCSLRELHSEGLRRILQLVNSGGDIYRPLREQFAQDDVIRSMLVCYDLHPVDLQTRLAECVGNVRPLIESYGGSVSIANISRDQVTLRLEISDSTGPSPVAMLKDLLEHAIVVAAPDVAEVRFDDQPPPPRSDLRLPIITAP